MRFSKYGLMASKNNFYAKKIVRDKNWTRDVEPEISICCAINIYRTEDEHHPMAVSINIICQ